MKKTILLILTITVLSCNSQSTNNEKQLFGIWQGYLKDSETNMKIEKIVLEFTPNGKFIQKIGEGKTQNIIQSEFRTEGNKIYSKEINSEQEDQANYYFDSENLIIDFEGIKNEYTRIK
jgi:hypothetical protein